MGGTRFAGDLSAALELPESAYGLAFIEEETGRIVFAGWDSGHAESTHVNLPSPDGMTHYEVINQEGEMQSEGDATEFLPLWLANRVTYVRFQ